MTSVLISSLVNKAVAVEVKRIVDTQGVVGGLLALVALLGIGAMIYLFRLLIAQQATHVTRIQGLESQLHDQDKAYAEALRNTVAECVRCRKEHDAAFLGMTAAFGEELRKVYDDLRAETLSLRAEATKIQDTATNAITRTGDGLSGVSNLLNRLIGMLGRHQPAEGD